MARPGRGSERRSLCLGGEWLGIFAKVSEGALGDLPTR